MGAALTGDWSLLEDLHITEDILSYEVYHRAKDVGAFDCGDRGLNKFLHDPEEVADYQDDGLGRTTLVYCRGCLVGFFTLCNDSLDLKYVDSKKLAKAIKKKQKEVLDSIPATKIGRFAVDKRVQSKGIGKLMMRYIVGYAVAQNEGIAAVRLLVLQAVPTAQAFYTRRGFWYTIEKDRERGRRNRTMFLDLDQLRDVA